MSDADSRSGSGSRSSSDSPSGIDPDPDPDSGSTSGFAPVSRTVSAVIRTRLAIGSLFRRRDAALVFAGVSMLYVALYLVAIGRLVPGGGEVGLLLVEDLSIAFRSTGTFTFEPIARIDLGPLTLLFSPLDTLFGFALAVLVGLNLALFYLAWTQPAACGIEGATGAFAAIPALLSGTACCGPVLLIVLGIQASGLLLAVFDVLLPLAVVVLLGSLVLVSRNVDPTLL